MFLCCEYLFGYELLIDVTSYLDLNKGRSTCDDWGSVKYDIGALFVGFEVLCFCYCSLI